MTKFERVKSFYDHELWTLDQVKKAVVCGWITEAEYKTITGKKYVAA